MSDPLYDEQIELMSKRGFTLDSRIERKQVNGLYGMYATSPINAGEVLVSYPVDQQIPLAEGFDYTGCDNFDVKYAHTAAREFVKGKESEYYPYFLKLETMEEIKANSCYFYNEGDLDFIKKMNVILFNKITEYNRAIKSMSDSIIAIDPSLDKELLVLIILNMNSRSWGRLGFLPIFELFNHCDLKGITLRNLENGTKRGYVSRINYQPGEQIWVAYNRQDMYNFAVAYNYFDPTGSHFINFSGRMVQHAKSDLEKQVFKLTSQRHKLRYQEANGVISYQLNEPNTFFLDSAPNANQIRYIRNNCFQNVNELTTGLSSDSSFDRRMLEILDFLLHVNNVDAFSPKDVPEKLGRFYSMLVKEKKMLNANRKWVFMNSKDYIIHPSLANL